MTRILRREAAKSDLKEIWKYIASEPSQKSLGGLATKTQANDRETVSARSPRLTLAFWAMSFPKVGINFFPPTRSVRYSQKETPFLATSFFEAGESISTPSSIITAGTATDMHV